MKKQDLALAEQIRQRHAIQPVTARVLAARGFIDSEILSQFLDPTLARGLPSPELCLSTTEISTPSSFVPPWGGALSNARHRGT